MDLSGLPPGRRWPEAERLAGRETAEPFDLTGGPVLRARLLRTEPREHALVLAVHHVACDGWSWGVLYSELGALYRAAVTGRPARLAGLPVQYADFAVWQRRWIEEEVLATQLAYWRRQLADLPLLALPADQPRPPVRSGRGGEHLFTLSAELTAAARRLAQREEATLFMVLLGAFAVLLNTLSGQEEVVVGTDAAGRVRPELEGIVGLFVNQLVLRVDLAGEPAFRDLLQRIKRVTLEAFAHQDVPFDRVVEVVNPPRDPSRTPLFQVKLVLQNTPGAAGELPDLALAPLRFHNRTAKFDLLLNLVETDGMVQGALEHSTDLFTAASAAGMAELFTAVLSAVLAEPEAPLAHLRQTVDAARQRLEARRREQRRDERGRALQGVRRKRIAAAPREG